MVPDAKRFNHLDFEAGRAWNMNRYGGYVARGKAVACRAAIFKRLLFF